jgi:hypothetical protein
MCGHSFHPRHAKTACPGAPVLAEWPRGVQLPLELDLGRGHRRSELLPGTQIAGGGGASG